MQPLPISPLEREDVFVSGDVTIHGNAAIAPGVVLQAGQNGRIVIADGVCLGLGVVLHAHNGNIYVKAGSNLGAGVLIIGACTVGPYASIGAASTIIDRDIAADAVVAAGTVLGDRSRSQKAAQQDLSETSSAAAEMPSPWESDSPELSVDPTSPADPEADSEPPSSEPDSTHTQTPQSEPEPGNSTTEVDPNPAVVKRFIYGQVHVNQMLTTLFPHAQRFKSGSNSPPSPPSNQS